MLSINLSISKISSEKKFGTLGFQHCYEAKYKIPAGLAVVVGCVMKDVVVMGDLGVPSENVLRDRATVIILIKVVIKC